MRDDRNHAGQPQPCGTTARVRPYISISKSMIATIWHPTYTITPTIAQHLMTIEAARADLHLTYQDDRNHAGRPQGCAPTYLFPNQ